METRVLRRNGGFTLIEALVAMVILSIVLVGMQATLTQRLSGDLKLQDVRNVAIQLAADRIRTVQLDPVYGALGARYAASENAITGAPGYQRVTDVTRTVAGGNDYTTISVKVTHPRLAAPVTRSIVVAAP